MGDGMARFKGGNDAFGAAQSMESPQRFVIRYCHILGAAAILEPGVFGAYPRVVEAGRNRMGLGNLPVFVLQEIGAVAMQYTRPAGQDRRRMLAGRKSQTTR